MNKCELHDVSVQFGSQFALQDVSFQVRSAERVAFIGPSGAGKTSLFRLIHGVLSPTSGQVIIDETDVSHFSSRQWRPLRCKIGWIPQGFGLVPNLRVLHNVLAGRLGRMNSFQAARMFLVPNAKETAAVHHLLDRVGIAEKLYQRTDRLSAGQQQRVAIARALYQMPSLLLADEPVSNVDPARAEATVDLLCNVATEERITLCMSLHNLHLAKRYFERLIGIRRGRVIFDLPASDFNSEEYRQLYELDDAELLSDSYGD
ncbi:MAG: ATP-binding cassette domain-containing protein [Pirellulaceae bacterium]